MCVGFVRLCRKGVDAIIDTFPGLLAAHQNGMVIFMHCRSGHSRGPAFRNSLLWMPRLYLVLKKGAMV